jgi:hypothetical protein
VTVPSFSGQLPANRGVRPVLSTHRHTVGVIIVLEGCRGVASCRFLSFVTACARHTRIHAAHVYGGAQASQPLINNKKVFI